MALREDFGPIPNAKALVELYKSYEENENLVKIPFFESLGLELGKKNSFESLIVILKDNNKVILWETLNCHVLNVAHPSLICQGKAQANQDGI